jgi:hypothetical protein
MLDVLVKVRTPIPELFLLLSKMITNPKPISVKIKSLTLRE